MVVWPGRTFLCRRFDLLFCFCNDSHPIRLNVKFIKDLAWRVEFLRQWNGISFFLSFFPHPFSLSFFLSVLMHLVLLVMVLSWTKNGSVVAALLPNFHCPLLTRNFFLLFWQPMFGVPVVLAGISCFMSITKLLFTFLTNGHLQTQTLCIYSLLKVAACFSFTFAAIHASGRNNGIADALSHFNFLAFHSQVPHAKKFPVLIPHQLLAQLSIVI